MREFSEQAFWVVGTVESIRKERDDRPVKLDGERLCIGVNQLHVSDIHLTHHSLEIAEGVVLYAWKYWQFEQADHGETFARWTDRLNIAQHCERFTSPKWWLVCVDCGQRIGRYRRSKTVRNPEDYQCGDCGENLRVEEDPGQ